MIVLYFIEIWLAHGGCLEVECNSTNDIRLKRNEAIYREDAGMEIRKFTKTQGYTLYKEYLENLWHKSLISSYTLH